MMEGSAPIGRIYDGGYAFAEPEHARAYADAIDDPTPLEGGVCPPMFHVRLFKTLMFTVACDPDLGLDLLRLVHGEHDATFHRPLRPWDLVQLRARLESVDDKPSGRVVTARLFGLVEGELAIEARTVYFVRGPGGSRRSAEPPPEPAPAPEHVAAVTMTPDQSLRYAAASLDDNPIHTVPEVARFAGLPDVIVHGLCTLAKCGVALTGTLAGGDARRIRRLGARFSRPVPNGASLEVGAWRTHDDAWAWTATHGGAPAVTQGVVELRA